jgi:hypothetical protein
VHDPHALLRDFALAAAKTESDFRGLLRTLAA